AHAAVERGEPKEVVGVKHGMLLIIAKPNNKYRYHAYD
ncbi:MAG: hypothetical protein ACI94D_002485, partial [Neolewinella sp.]